MIARLSRPLLAAAVSAAVLVPSASLLAQGRNVEIKTTRVAGTVHLLEGRGGNIGVCVGADGVFMIDDQFANMTGKITAAVAAITPEPVRFLVNTHWHGDHTGGNENFGEIGAVIVAHENVRARMSEEQFIAAFDSRTPAAPKAALPVVTFTEDIRFHWNDETIHVMHVDPAHTDGDSIVRFEKANVLHMGDVYFNGMYPFIDASTGGRIAGMIAAVDRALGLCDRGTRIIPGHGPLSDVETMRGFRDMLAKVQGRVRALIDEGRSREEVVAAKPTKDLDADWGGGFLQPDVWVGIVFDSMQ